MRRILAILALCLPVLAFAADRCVSDIGTRTSGSCAATCNATDFATAATCYNSAAQGSSSVTTALTQSAADGDTITIDDGIHSISANILASSMTGPNPGTVTVRCRTATRGSCGFTQSSATAANFSYGSNTLATAWVFQNLACTKSVAHTSTTVAACWHNTGTATTNVTFDGVYAYGITYNVGTSTTGTAVANITSASNRTMTFQNGALFSGITVNGTAAVPAALLWVGGTNDLVITGTASAPGLTVSGTALTDAQNAIFCQDDCDIAGLTVTGLTVTDTDAQWNGFIGASDTALTATMSANTFTASTFRIAPTTSLAPMWVTFSGPGSMSSSSCTNNTVTMSGTPTTPIGPCWLSKGPSGDVTQADNTITGNTAPLGLAGYANQGGKLISSRLRVTGNTAGQGLIYCGGWGQCDLFSSIITGNTQDYTGENAEGFALLCQMQSTASADRTCTVGNNTITDNTLRSDATGSVTLRNNVSAVNQCGGASCDNTLTMYNTVLRNGKSAEIYVNTAANNTNTLNLDASNLTNSTAPSSSTGAGTYTENLAANKANQQTAPQFVCATTTTPSCYKTLSGSPLRRNGYSASTAPVLDYQSRNFEKPRDIGAYQSGGGFQAAARTARN